MSAKCIPSRIRWTERFSYLSIFKLYQSQNFKQILLQTQKYLGSSPLCTSHTMKLRSTAISDKKHIFLDPSDLFSCNQPYEFRRIILQSPSVVVRGSRSGASCQNSRHWRKHLSGWLKINCFLFSKISHSSVCCYHSYLHLRQFTIYLNVIFTYIHIFICF